MLNKIFYMVILISTFSFAQFKNQKNTPAIFDGITNYSPSGFFSNFLSPENFQMHHTFDMSYSAFGKSDIALTTYTNSMALRLSENLNIELDASLIASPYSSLGEQHQKSLSGFYLTRAQLNYRISKDAHLTIQYLNTPAGMYYNNNYYNQRYSRNYWERGY